MKFTEIDGLRYEVRCCDDCPFFNNGAGFEYMHTCQHPAWDRKEYMTISEFKTHEMHDKLCPLRDSKPGEGGVIDPTEAGVVDPCGIEMFFLSPLDCEKEIVIPEHIMEVLSSLKVENEKPRRTMVMDDEQKVATIECEAMEKALAYMSELIGKVETAIENSEPIMQGIYLERLKHAIMTEYNDMIRRQVEARE